MPAPRKKPTPWHLYFVLLLAAWVAAGHPLPEWLPANLGSAPFIVPDGKMSLVVIGQLDKMARQELVAEGLAHKAADAARIRYRHVDPTQSVAADAVWVQNAANAKRGTGPWFLISDGKRGESLALPLDPTANVTKYGG